MTMTEIEAKALALVNTHAINRRSDLGDAKHTELRCALLDAVQSQAATEARHAEEMRELKERFSEAALLVDGDLEARGFSKTGPMRSRLAPFILPAPDPDPLVEAFASLPVGFAGCVDGADALRAAMQARGYEWRKIGEAGE